ncbi:MAG TPA: DoxX family protein [Fimbriimonadaceae bacterium]|nr:DoxX family protein [Fimbriimonadaceae bacterium]
MVANPNTKAQGIKREISSSAATVLVGRFCFAGIFIASAPMHFSKTTIEMAASQGVPLAAIAVPASGLLALAGGLSILLGYRAKLGAWALVAFLVPVTLMMHPFWAAADKEAMTLQLTMFMKNLSLIGGALLITQFGAGPMSLDSRQKA